MNSNPLFAELNADMSENKTLSLWQPTLLSAQAKQYSFGACKRHVLACSAQPVNLLAAELFFLILAHPVLKCE